MHRLMHGRSPCSFEAIYGVVRRNRTNNIMTAAAAARRATQPLTSFKLSRAASSASSALPPPPATMPRRRVVVTGVGLVSPLGVGAERAWRRVLAGRCGVRALDFGERFPCKVGAPVPRGEAPGEFDVASVVDNARTQDSGFISFALAAATEALADAAWPPTPDASANGISPQPPLSWDPGRSGVALAARLRDLAALRCCLAQYIVMQSSRKTRKTYEFESREEKTRARSCPKYAQENA